MGVIASAWSVSMRARRKYRRRSITVGGEEARLQWVRANAPGRSFADIGGVFKYVGDIAFLAEDSGASAVTLFDVGDPDLPCEGHLEWGRFCDKHEARGSKVRYVQGTLEDPIAVEQIGVHDLVFFSGVLYHTPVPMQQLLQLRQITGERLFLSTLSIPEIPGFPQACVFYPYLPERERGAVAAGYYWAKDLLGIGAPVDERPMYGFGNCYWGMTRSALHAMLRVARFEAVEEWTNEQTPYMTELVARPLPLDPMLPPVDYFRERAAARERGEPRWAFDGWYDERRAAGLSTTNSRPAAPAPAE